MKDHNLNAKFPKYNNLVVRPLYKKRRAKRRHDNLFEFPNNNPSTKGEKLEHKDKVNVDRNVKIYEQSSAVNGAVIANENLCIFEETLPGVCESESTTLEPKNYLNKVNIITAHAVVNFSGTEKKGDIVANEKDSRRNKYKSLKCCTRRNSKIFKMSTCAAFNSKDCWLRVLPAAQPRGGPCCMLLRGLLCQLGLAATLALLTAAAAVLLYCAEGAYEEEVAAEFAKKRKQLVIELATELRQITSVSPSWVEAIERRLVEATELSPAGSGYWDLPGAVLFAVSVMAAMGFGAPMPRTDQGRSTALIYAIVAVPAHLFLVMNASAAVMSAVQTRLVRCRDELRVAAGEDISHGNSGEKRHGVKKLQGGERQIFSKSNAEVMKNTRRLQLWLLSWLGYGQALPLASAVFYALGVVAFGFARGATHVEAMTFPLRFAAGGGLEKVSGAVRVCYAVYIEGAALLAACAITAARAQATPLAAKYGLCSCADGESCRVPLKPATLPTHM